MQLRKMLVAAAVVCLPFASVPAAYAATSVPAELASHATASETDPDVQTALDQLIASAMGAEGLPELSDEINGLEAALQAWTSSFMPDVPELPATPGATS